MSKVLLVDDDPRELELLRNAIEAAGVPPDELATARTCAEAVARLAGDAVLPRLILLDLRLANDESGLAFLREVRELSRTRRIPVVMLSGTSRDADLTESYEDGANAYLVKPDTPEELELLVQRTLRVWLQHNKLPPAGQTDADVERWRARDDGWADRARGDGK